MYSDCVTIHVPSTDLTRNMFNEDALRKMKRESHLINNARGDIVDLDALTRALNDGHIAGAAVDVFPDEPESNNQPFSSPLSKVPNVILTPHIGGSTIEAQVHILYHPEKHILLLIVI
jgi:D-3-phosphoglycerate dehydrogenase